MRVLVKFFVFDLPPGFEDAVMDLPPGATVGDVLDGCLELFGQRGVSMDEGELRTSTVIIGGRWAGPGDPVSDGDTVSIVRPMDGG